MPAPTRDELREHLVAARIAGSVATPAGDVLAKAAAVAAGDPTHSFGLTGLARFSPEQVLAEVQRQFGWSPTPGEPAGAPTFIEPELLLDELDRTAERLAAAARDGEHVVLATGHPTGVLTLWQRVARGLAGAGAKVGRPADGVAFIFSDRDRTNRRQLRYLANVATLASGANLYHTHAAQPMELLLDQAGEVDLVVADHGFAGVAGERGLDVVSIADINDPALPMAKADGRVGVVLPMDDNVLPASYDPVGEYLVARL